MRGLARIALLLISACAAPRQDPLADYHVATSRGGLFTVAWRVPGADLPPVNEPFELEVLLFAGEQAREPVSHATLAVSAWMPAHAHGMNRRPEASEVSPGRYRVRGLLLHMPGHWQLFVDGILDGVSQRATFDLELE